jgi:hypothetical protein
MSELRKRHKFDSKTYNLAKLGSKQAWAYNQTSATVDVFISNGSDVIRIPIRKSVLKKLAELP